jgi:hypothetical protein
MIGWFASTDICLPPGPSLTGEVRLRVSLGGELEKLVRLGMVACGWLHTR